MKIDVNPSHYHEDGVETKLLLVRNFEDLTGFYICIEAEYLCAPSVAFINICFPFLHCMEAKSPINHMKR